VSDVGEPSNNTKNKLGWQAKKPVVLPGEKTKGTRVDIDLVKTEAQVNDHGVRVKVYRTSFCPNVKSIDGSEHNIDCTLCFGSGLIDRHPICTKAFIQTQSLKPENFPEGWVMDNSVAATFPIGIELFYYTLVELQDYTEIFVQNVQRQTSGADLLKYKACGVNFLIDSSNLEYYMGQDFNLDENGSIAWISGKGPSVGTIYSVHYESSVQFRAIRAIKSNRFIPVSVEGGVKQIKAQEQWILQKEFLVTRTDSSGNLLTPNTINPL